MVNRNWLDFFGWEQGMENVTELPPQTAATQFEQPRISPQQQYVQRQVSNTVIPHVHPSHMTRVNQHFIHHQHHFPHTESAVNECYETHMLCGTPFMPQYGQHHRGCNRCRKR